MSLDLHSLSRTTTVVGARFEWRVCVLSISARARAGDGLPFVGEFQTKARGGEAADDAVRAAVAADPKRLAQTVEYMERAAMQAVTGVREPGGEWQRVQLVPPASEDVTRHKLSVAVLDAETLGAVSSAALGAAREAADTAASFPAEE